MEIVQTNNENESNNYRIVFYHAIEKKALKIAGYSKADPSDKFVNDFTTEEFTAIGDFINSFINMDNEIDMGALSEAIELIRNNY